MLVFEYKVKPDPAQIANIEEAIRTVKFVRNKVLRYWIDETKNSKNDLFKYNTRLRKEYDFVNALNSTACQASVERVLKAVNKFFDNCKQKVKGKKGYPKFSKSNRSIDYSATRSCGGLNHKAFKS